MEDNNGMEINSREILFDEVPIRPHTEDTIQSDETENTGDSITAKALKKRIIETLKPQYHALERINPALAQRAKNDGLKIVHRLSGKANVKIVGEMQAVDILVDSTEISRTVFTTGIQRVVGKMIQNFPNSIVIGRLYDNCIVTNNALCEKFKKIKYQQGEYRINPYCVKKLVLLDSSWADKAQFENFIQKVHRGGGYCYSVIYDLISVRHPEVVGSDEFARRFTEWHNMVLQKSDHIMCISKSVADDVITYYNEQKFRRKKPLKISYFPLGADLRDTKEVNLKFVRKCLQRFINKPTFLMVGTIEPRKGHMIVLEAFTKLLDSGKDINLLIIGRNGWKNDEILNYISNSKYNKTNILWIQDASDYELNWAYQQASCLIAASLDEGYGLPLIEGAQYGIPIICSDIPVFREVSQGYADFFRTFDADSLVKCIESWLATDEHPDTSKMKIYTWKDAADIFMEIVDGKREPYRIIS